MDYHIALSPDLGLSPSDFVTTWNELESSRQVAHARLSSSKSAQYDPFLLGTLALLSTVAVGVGTNALYDLIKQVFVKHGVHKRLHIEEINKPDGTHTIVVDIEEE